MKAHNPRVGIIIEGYPKAGKTGALAALANSGRYKIALMSFDNNPDPLYAYVTPENFKNVSILTLTDKLKDDGKRIVCERPEAFKNALKALNNWVDDDGNDWGAVQSWDNSYVLVLDSLTSMGEAAFRRRRAVRFSGVHSDDSDSDWGAAMRDQSDMLEMLKNHCACNVAVLSHLKTIEPKLLRESSKDPDDVKKAKAAISKLRAENANVRICPSALGQALPPEIARHLPAVVLVDGNRNGKRVIVTKGEDGLDLGVPSPHIKRVLPLETGLLTIFDAILSGECEDVEEE